MPEFSQVSKDRLAQCHPDLVRLFEAVIKTYDCAVMVGFRDEADQDQAFKEGKSKVVWPNSLHNKQPSMAVDVMPVPVRWNDNQGTLFFAGFVLGTATSMGIKVRWGGDWKGTHDPAHNSFSDLDHFELR